MRRSHIVAGLSLLALCMVGWAALVWADPDTGKKPAPKEAPPELELPPLPGVSAPTAPVIPLKSSNQALPVTEPAVPPMRSAPSKSAAAPTTPAGPPPVPGVALPPPSPSPTFFPAPAGLPKTSGTRSTTQPGTIDSIPADPQTFVIPPANEGKPTAKPSLPPRQAAAAATQANEDKNSETPAIPDHGTGRQEPALSIEWIGPPTAKVGVPAEYSLVVRSACSTPVQQVLVRVRMPAGVAVAATEPQATTENSILVWELGTMLPRQEKNLMLRMIPETRGDIAPQAWVTFTGSSVARIKVREPKLVLKAAASNKLLVGDSATFTLTVSNPGDGVAEQVKVHAVLSDGLEHPRGNKVHFEIGNLAAGESRSLQLICGTKTGGLQKCEAVAEADGGLTGKDAASVNVIMPRLDVVMNGPALRYLDRKAIYTIKVTNPGDAAASNVTVGDVVPAGFKVLAASDGGRHDVTTRTVSWFLGEIGPGQSKEVKLEVQAAQIGDHKHRASVSGARGLRAESELGTRVEGLSAIMLELVDTEDPIEVNGETTYQVRITNTGSKTETDIKLVASIPEKMAYKSSQGPTRGREEGSRALVFDKIEKLAPHADAVYRIAVKCLEPGVVRFKIQVTSTNLTEPVIKMEATRIYSDAPESK